MITDMAGESKIIIRESIRERYEYLRCKYKELKKAGKIEINN